MPMWCSSVWPFGGGSGNLDGAYGATGAIDVLTDKVGAAAHRLAHRFGEVACRTSGGAIGGKGHHDGNGLEPGKVSAWAKIAIAAAERISRRLRLSPESKAPGVRAGRACCAAGTTSLQLNYL